MPQGARAVRTEGGLAVAAVEVLEHMRSRSELMDEVRHTHGIVDVRAFMILLEVLIDIRELIMADAFDSDATDSTSKEGA